MNYCKTCVNDGNSHGIVLNSEGICNYCEEYEKLKSYITDYDSLIKLWLGRIKKYQGKGDYDVLLGFSGGKDSTYVLHQLMLKYNLKVKTCTFDNGFLNDYARNKIAALTKEFGVDHEFVSFRKEDLLALYKMSIELSGGTCFACELLVASGLVKKATESSIPMAVLGSSRPQIFHRYLSKQDTVKKQLIKTSLTPVDKIDITKAYKAIYNKLVSDIPEHLFKAFFPDPNSDILAEFVPFFIYHPYDERQIISFLENHTTWKKHSNYDIFSHYDCLVQPANYYLIGTARRNSLITSELSVSVREGTLDRQEALSRLERELRKDIPDESLKTLSDYVGISVKNLVDNAKKLDKKYSILYESEKRN